MFWRTLLSTVLAGAALTGVATAQDAINYATVSGRVVDPSGAPLPGTTVHARQTDTNGTADTLTDADGRFRLAYLRPGPYDLTTRLPGFAPVVEHLTLTAGAAFDVRLSLALQTVTTELTVSATAERLEAGRTQVSTTLRQSEVQAVPLSGRQFLDLALLTPGVSPTNVGGGTQLFAETSALPGVGVSVASQRNLSNNFMVDGLSANDDAAALAGVSYGVDTIAEFQVVTSGGQAELGRALGGHISISTRSGTNVRRGDAYGFFRDDRLNGANALTGRRLPMQQRQVGASMGGPIARDRTFVFANVEDRRLEQSGLVTIGATDATLVDRINTRLSAVGYSGPRVASGLYANPITTTHLFARLDHGSDRDLLMARYSAYQADSQNARGAGGTSAASASAGLDNLDQTIAGAHVWAASARTIVETRGQFASSHLEAEPTDPVGPSVAVAGVATFGRLSSSPTGRRNTLYQLVTNVSHQAGPHAWRAGADVLVNHDTITFPRAVRGAYTFASLTAFLAGTYNTSGFTQTFGATDVAQVNPNLGVYVQDEWRVGPGWTITAGLRHELQWLETIRTDRNNVSPRLGLVWSPRQDGRVVVRANGGRYFDRVPLRALANALLSGGNTTDLDALRQTAVTLSPTQSGAPAFPNILAAVVPTTTLVNFTTMDRHLASASSDKGSVEVEGRIGRSSTIAVGYDWLRGRNLILQINQNVPTCAASGSNNGCRPDAAYANNNQYRGQGRSHYHGLHVSLVQRPATWGSYRVSYTRSRSMNNVGEAFFNGPLDPFDLEKDWARSDDDQRHRLVISGTISTPDAGGSAWRRVTGNLQISGTTQAYSAVPFTITTGANTVFGTAARPTIDGAFIGRNTGQASPFSTTHLRISRTVAMGGRARIEGLVEVFNVFNQRNSLARVTVFGTGTYPTNPAATFGTVTVVGEARSVQLGFRVRF